MFALGETGEQGSHVSRVQFLSKTTRYDLPVVFYLCSFSYYFYITFTVNGVPLGFALTAFMEKKILCGGLGSVCWTGNLESSFLAISIITLLPDAPDICAATKTEDVFLASDRCSPL